MYQYITRSFYLLSALLLSSAGLSETVYQMCSDSSEDIQVSGLLRHEGEIVVNSEQPIFGDIGPELIFRSNLFDSVVGQRYDLSTMEGQGNISMNGELLPLVEGAVGMPFDRAFVVGAEGTGNSSHFGNFKVVSELGSTPATYEHVMFWWPKEHQENAQAVLNSESTWQIKTLWHFFSEERQDDLARFHNSFGLWFKTGQYFLGSSLVGTIFSSYGMYPELATNDYNLNRSSFVKDDKFISQTYIKHDPNEGGDGYIEMRLRSLDSGAVGYWLDKESRTAVVSTTDPHLGPDQFTFPGFTRGFLTQLNAHVYFADIYVAHGEGASARVELVNKIDYQSANKVSPFTVEAWTDDSITVKAKLGIFSTQMSGDDELYFAVHNSSNELVAMVEYCGRLSW